MENENNNCAQNITDFNDDPNNSTAQFASSSMVSEIEKNTNIPKSIKDEEDKEILEPDEEFEEYSSYDSNESLGNFSLYLSSSNESINQEEKHNSFHSPLKDDTHGKQHGLRSDSDKRPLREPFPCSPSKIRRKSEICNISEDKQSVLFKDYCSSDKKKAKKAEKCNLPECLCHENDTPDNDSFTLSEQEVPSNANLGKHKTISTEYECDPSIYMTVDSNTTPVYSSDFCSPVLTVDEQITLLITSSSKYQEAFTNTSENFESSSISQDPVASTSKIVEPSSIYQDSVASTSKNVVASSISQDPVASTSRNSESVKAIVDDKTLSVENNKLEKIAELPDDEFLGANKYLGTKKKQTGNKKFYKKKSNSSDSDESEKGMLFAKLRFKNKDIKSTSGELADKHSSESENENNKNHNIINSYFNQCYQKLFNEARLCHSEFPIDPTYPDPTTQNSESLKAMRDDNALNVDTNKLKVITELRDDEFMEADRYLGNKGKQAANKKYRYTKKSKSSDNEKSEKGMLPLKIKDEVSKTNSDGLDDKHSSGYPKHQSLGNENDENLHDIPSTSKTQHNISDIGQNEITASSTTETENRENISFITQPGFDVWDDPSMCSILFHGQSDHDGSRLFHDQSGHDDSRQLLKEEIVRQVGTPNSFSNPNFETFDEDRDFQYALFLSMQEQ